MSEEWTAEDQAQFAREELEEIERERRFNAAERQAQAIRERMAADEWRRGTLFPSLPLRIAERED